MRDRYSTVAILLHWLIAGGIALQIMLGWHMGEVEGAARSLMLQVHKTVGVAILVLTVARLGWRLVNPPPPQHSSLTPLELKLAHWVHVGFYALLLALPLTGWAMVSMESVGGVRLMNGLSWPAFPILTLLPGGVQDTLAGIFNSTHSALVWVMLALMALHIAGALKHQFVSKDPTLARMLPGAKAGAIVEPRLIGVVAAAGALAAIVYLPNIPEPPKRPVPKSLAAADIYLDIVEPALDRRCSACHSDDDSRGGFSLSTYDGLMRGGHDGASIKPGDAKGSDLIRRVTLSPTHKDYMPQGEKPPLSADQIAAIEVWINAGAPASGLVGSMKLTDAQKTVLQKALPKGDDDGGDDLPVSGSIDPLPTVPPADETIVNRLESQSFIVRKVDKSSNLIDVNYNGFKDVTDEQLADLAKLGPQIFTLSLRKSGVTDAQMKTLAQFKNLRTLRLQDTAITDAGISQLSGLGELRELSLASTKVTDASLSTVAGFKKLKALFVWNTAVTPTAIDKFKEEHKDIRVVSGVKPEDVVHDTTLLKPQN